MNSCPELRLFFILSFFGTKCTLVGKKVQCQVVFQYFFSLRAGCVVLKYRVGEERILVCIKQKTLE